MIKTVLILAYRKTIAHQYSVYIAGPIIFAYWYILKGTYDNKNIISKEGTEKPTA